MQNSNVTNRKLIKWVISLVVIVCTTLALSYCTKEETNRKGRIKLPKITEIETELTILNSIKDIQKTQIIKIQKHFFVMPFMIGTRMVIKTEPEDAVITTTTGNLGCDCGEVETIVLTAPNGNTTIYTIEYHN